MCIMQYCISNKHLHNTADVTHSSREQWENNSTELAGFLLWLPTNDCNIFKTLSQNATWNVFILRCISYCIKNNHLHLNHIDIYHVLKKGSACSTVEEITLFSVHRNAVKFFQSIRKAWNIEAVVLNIHRSENSLNLHKAYRGICKINKHGNTFN